MPAPSSSVRLVPAIARRVRTWLSFLRWALVAVLLLSLALVSPDGTEVAGRALASLVLRGKAQPDCGDTLGAWAAVVDGRGPVTAFDGCAPAIGGAWWRRVVLQRVALRGGRGQAHAARVLLVGATDDPGVLAEVILSAPSSGRRQLLHDRVLLVSLIDIPVFAERVPVGGAFDRGLILGAGDPTTAARMFEAVLSDLDEEERAWVTAPPREIGRPGSALEADAPPSDPPPAAEGIFAWVAEPARDHVATEWWHLVDFVRRGLDRPPSATPDLRWARAGESVRTGPPISRIHAVLRGDPAPPALAAWVLSSLATASGLPVRASRRSVDIQLSVGGTTLWLGACGARWVGPPDPLATDLALPEVRDEALAALVAEALRTDLWPSPEAIEASEGTLPLALRSALRLHRGEALDSLDALSPEERSLVGWWAAHSREPELARLLSAEPASGAAEFVRFSTMSALGEPGDATRARPRSGCEDFSLPWPAIP